MFGPIFFLAGPLFTWIMSCPLRTIIFLHFSSSSFIFDVGSALYLLHFGRSSPSASTFVGLVRVYDSWCKCRSQNVRVDQAQRRLNSPHQVPDIYYDMGVFSRRFAYFFGHSCHLSHLLCQGLIRRRRLWQSLLPTRLNSRM